MQLGLDIAAVEVVVGPGGEGWESHLVPKVRAEVSQVVDVEARVNVEDSRDSSIPYIASDAVWRVWKWERSGWGKFSRPLVEVVCVSAVSCLFGQAAHGCVVQ
jgi:hypothetical protein